MPNWIKSLGVTAVVALSGYVAEMGRESLLGIQIHDFTFDRYATAFATFALDSLTILSDAVTQNLTSIALVVVIAIAVAVGVVAVQSRRRITTTVLFASTLVLLLYGPYLIVEWEAPVLDVSGFLTQNANVERGFVHNRKDVAALLWNGLTCRSDKLHQLGLLCRNDLNTGEAVDRWYQRLLGRVIAITAVFAMFELALSGASRKTRPRRVWVVAGYVVSPAVSVVTAMVVILLPYVHAKARPATGYATVAVCVKDHPCEKDHSQAVVGFLLHRDDSALTLYEQVDASHARVTAIPVSQIERIDTARASADTLFEYHVHLTATALP
jgi:hypothetical protein